MSIMIELTAKGTREIAFDSVVISPLTPVVIAPLGVLIPLVIVAPSRLVLLGLIPALAWVVIVPVSSFLFGIIRQMGQICRIHLFKVLILLNGRGLNKIHPSVRVCGGHGLWRTRKGKVQILWGL
jgi:hypothetical protein